ncbi:hypothetical protein BME38_09450 [Klebsiella pneumoniae]|nr:hypothetical protein BMD98_09480 [Klebsiella pneumoniae]OVU43941.1 hypothetical protein BME16_12395 [Klebsiella pneumoniae]OVU55134.1 hypothetical protein BME15_07935 [Klebsiella pneumoniae]OVU70883.1 hypothetical protein BME11_09460 [Klebsiella pneumoniae]OVU85870.1 hypothetical protein BME08_09925 [Klebsiella pneumoniae]
MLLWDRDTPHLSTSTCVRVISAGCDPTSNYLKSNLQFFNINSTLRSIWYDQIILLDSGD